MPAYDQLDPRTRRLLVARSVGVGVAVVVLVVTAYYLIPWTGADGGTVAFRLALGLLLLLAAVVVSFRLVVGAHYPMLRAVELLGLVVSLAVVTFASAYVVMSGYDPAAFSEPLGRTDGLYFSLTTSTTIGYGDINAVSEAARIVVMVHMVTNVAVLGIFAKVIVNAARRRVDAR